MVKRYVARKLPPTAFKKGDPKLPNAGRVKGTPNKTTALIKDAITGAAEQLGTLEPIYRGKGERKVIIGWKPTGKGGTTGYLVWLGCNHPTAFATLMGKMLPMQINATVKRDQTVADRFADVDLSKMPLAEKMAAFREMITLTRPMPVDQPKELAGPVVDGVFSEVPREAAE